MIVRVRNVAFVVVLAVGMTAAFWVTSAHAQVSCSTDPSYETSIAAVVDRGYAWSSASQPNPLWEVTFTDLNESVDVYATSDSDARSVAAQYLVGEINNLGCTATSTDTDTATVVTPPPSTTQAAQTVAVTQATTITQDCLSEAAQLVAASSVSYVGNSWGPVPIWRVDLRPGLNATVDVAADSGADAQIAVIAVVQWMLNDGCTNSGDGSAPAQLPVSTTPTDTEGASGGSVAVAAPQETSFAVDGDSNLTGLSANADQGVFAVH